MKAIVLFFFISVLSLQNIAQTIKADSIFWDDGRTSLLSQLGPIWILVKQGSDKKDVRIVEIKKVKGILVYEKEKTLHDIAIHNIEKIQPGQHPLSSMLFHPDNTPYIKRELFHLDPMLSYSDFKSINVAVKTIELPIQKTEEKICGCDTLIEENGQVRLIKIIEIDSKFITYTTAKGMNSPFYVKCINNASVKRYKTCITVNFTMK